MADPQETTKLEWVIVAAFLVALAAMVASSFGFGAEPPANKYKLINVKVVDGDTIGGDVELPFSVTLRKQRVRFLGVDAWETRGEQRPLGLLAKEYTEAKVRGSEVWLVPDGKRQRDNFGRILAHPWVFRDGKWTDLSESLIENRHGVRYVE